MKILHYLYGIPPVRGGGLITYAIELANMQAQMGEEVFVLYPGNFDKKNEKTRVSFHKKEKKVSYYKIINPLPVPVGKGIVDIELFTKAVDGGKLKAFLGQFEFEVLHVHSLMGLHKEFLESAKQMQLKIVFTSHDYFGICPKPELFNCREEVCADISWSNCNACCKEAYSYKRMKMEQASWFPIYKSSRLVGELKRIRPLFEFIQKTKKKSDLGQATKSLETKMADYTKLREYYRYMFEMVDMFHFNSNITKEEYCKRIPIKNMKVISITNSSVKDQKKIRKYGDCVRLGYLGIDSMAKGGAKLIECLKELKEEGIDNFILNIYFDNISYFEEFMVNNKPYKLEELGRVMDANDCIIIPSQWKETFGFVALEALSFGVPVLVTENVGAKDLLKKGNYGIISGTDKESLKENIKKILLDRHLLQKMNESIVADFGVPTLESHTKEMLELYRLIGKEKENDK